MSTQTNPSQYPEQPSNYTPQDFVPEAGENTGRQNAPDTNYVPPRFTRPHNERLQGDRQERQHNRQPGERSIPEFLQRQRREPEAKPVRPRPPLDTVVPVLDDQAIAAEAPGLSPYELDELEREITRAQAHPRRSLSPELMPAPPLRPKSKVAGGRMTGLSLRLILVASIAVFFILLMLGKVPMPDSWKSAAAEPWRRLAALIRSEAAPPAANVPLIKTEAANLSSKPSPKLVVEGADAGSNDEIALGVKMTGPVEGVMATVTGLVPGTKLSRGQPWGKDEWLVPAHELAETKLRPPADFSGTMQYTVSLRTSDNKIADRQTLRLQWSQAQKPQRHLEQDEITTMVTRGQTMLESGDIASARLLLQRAAESGDQNAAMAMAATYDPAVMNELGVRGVEADVQKARYWYQKASEYGSKEAPKRLESLASQSR
jgi:hypothetical protein